MANDYMNVIEENFLAKNGEGFRNNGSRAKSRDGDESVAMASASGKSAGTWMEYLNDGATNPYPITAEALKTKNTRKNNDSFS